MNITLDHDSSNLQDIKVIIPEENLNAVDLTLEDRPYVGVFNTGIMELNPKDVFGWYLSIIIDYSHTIGEDMPNNEDTKRMQDFAEILSDNLSIDKSHPNALLLGRVTGDSHTQIMWYVNNPDLANEYLKKLIASGNCPFEFDYEICYDGEWEEAHFWLDPLR